MLASDLINKFRALAGDDSASIPDQMLIEAINLALNKITSVPKLSKAFSKHYTVNLPSKGECKWELDGDFRRLADIPMLNFYSIGEGGDPCPLRICPLDPINFYNKHGMVNLKQPGIPCEYTIEQEDDHTYLVVDRPLDIPLMVDYIAYGYPKPIEGFTEMDMETGKSVIVRIDPETGEHVPVGIEISAVVEQLILDSMREAYYAEAEDLAFSGAVLDILTNKYIPEALATLYKRFEIMPPTILGEP